MPLSIRGRGSTRLRVLLLSAIVAAAGLQWIGGEASWVGMRRIPMHGRTAMTRYAVDDLKIGEKVTGTVTGFFKNIGANVDLGLELPGFIHVAAMSKDRVEKPEDMLSIGDRITGRVLTVTRTTAKTPAQIKMSMVELPVFDKDLDAVNALKVGNEVTGTVTGFTKVGAMLDLGLPFPGFLHVKQMTGDRGKDPEGVFIVGEKVTARIRSVKGDRGGEVELTML